MEEKEVELTDEQKADLELVALVNTVCDIMDRKELGTTQDGDKRFGEILTELVQQGKVSWYDIKKKQAELNAALACYGYGTYGVEFIERILENKETAKTLLVSLITAATDEAEEK